MSKVEKCSNIPVMNCIDRNSKNSMKTYTTDDEFHKHLNFARKQKYSKGDYFRMEVRIKNAETDHKKSKEMMDMINVVQRV